MKCCARLALLSICCLIKATAQLPVIKPGGVVNGASFANDSSLGLAIAPREIVSVFGSNLADTVESASSSGPQLQLGGTSVTVGGLPAPLFFVSPSQLNLLIPSGLKNTGLPAPIVIKTAAGSTESVRAKVAHDAAGIFTQDGSGCGQGLVYNVLPDGGWTLNTPSQSASPGDLVSLYATGIGPVSENGTLLTNPGARLGLRGFEMGASIFAAGLGPAIGLDHAYVRIPTDAPEGCAIPISLVSLTSSSQPVTISIRRGGGLCQDAPLVRFASLAWQRAITSGPEPSAISVRESFAGSFAAAPENQVPSKTEAPPGSGGYRYVIPLVSSRCTGVAPKGLNAGRLRLASAGADLAEADASQSDGELAYSVELPLGSMAGHVVRVSGDGGPDIGAFESSLPIPESIRIATSLEPGTVIPIDRPFTVQWSRSGADALVSVQLVSHNPLGFSPYYETTVRASELAVTIPIGSLGLPVPPSDDAEVVVTMMPIPEQKQSFSAPGLTVAGKHAWSYEFRFRGLRIH